MASCVLTFAAVLCLSALTVPAAEPLTEFSAIRKLPRGQVSKNLPVEVEGTISLFVPPRKLMYLHTKEGRLSVVVPDEQKLPPVGSKVRVKGVTIAQARAHVRSRQIQQLEGPADAPPPTRSLSVAELLSDPPPHEMVEIRGVVRKWTPWGARLRIELRDGNHLVPLFLHGVTVPDVAERFYFSTSRIRAIVVPENPNQTNRFQLIAHGWDSVTVEKPEPESPFEVPSKTVAEILQLPKDQLLVDRARVRGRVTETRSDHSAVLDDGTGRIVIVPRYRLNLEVDDVADVLGFTELSPDGNSIRLEQVRNRPVRLPLELAKDPQRNRDWPSYLPEIGRLSNVRFLSSAMLSNRPPVLLQGNVVHMDAEAKSFILQNQHRGIEIVGYTADFELQSGHHVEVSGYAAPGRAATVVTNATIRRLADKNMAQPVVPSPEGMAGGRYDGMWISLDGVGRQVERTQDGLRLQLARTDRKFAIRLPEGDPGQLEHLVDARLLVQGIARAITDEHGAVSGSEIVVGSITNITVTDPATDPAALPSRPIADLRRIRPGGGFGRRYQTRGTVILDWPGLAYIAEGGHFLRVRTAGGSRAKVGETVVVIGFPNIDPPHLELDDALLEPTGNTATVPPRRLKSGEKLTDGQRGELVEVDARLIKQMVASPEAVLLARFGAETFSAVVPHSLAGDSFENLLEGSLLRLRGVLTIEDDPSGHTTSARLLLPHADAVTLLKAPPWWTPARLLSALALMTMAIALVLLRSFHLQRKVEESEGRLTNAALASPVAVVILSAEDGRIIEANERFLSDLDFSRKEVLGQTLDGLKIWPDENPLKRLRRAAGKKDEHPHTNWRAKSGETRSMVVSAEEIEFDSKPCLVVSGVDVTERTELLEQLRDSQKMEAVGQLAAGVAHDFNNLLTIINGNAEMLDDELPVDSPHRESNEDILRAGTRAAELTHHLLTFSRRQILRETHLELGEVVHSACRLLRRMLPETIELKFDKPEELRPIKADRGMMEQVLMNLAVNARDAMGDAGTLTLSVGDTAIDADQAEAILDAEPGTYAVLTVTDTGCGMDEATQHRIFEPFFTTKEVGKGTGLGLATVYGIVRQHRGWISVRSQPEQGTSFVVHLPLADSIEREQTDEPVANDRPGGSEKILLTEDDDNVRFITRKVLTRAGYQVVEAEDGVRALEEWKQHDGEFDALVSDVLMPKGMTGVDLARQLFARKPGLKIILISGYSGDNIDLPELDTMGAIFLNKPVAQEVLLTHLRELLEAKAVDRV